MSAKNKRRQLPCKDESKFEDGRGGGRVLYPLVLLVQAFLPKLGVNNDDRPLSTVGGGPLFGIRESEYALFMRTTRLFMMSKNSERVMMTYPEYVWKY